MISMGGASIATASGKLEDSLGGLDLNDSVRVCKWIWKERSMASVQDSELGRLSSWPNSSNTSVGVYAFNKMRFS